MNTDSKPRPRFSERVLLRFSDGEYVDGLWVGTLAIPGVDPGGMNQRIKDALDVIRTSDAHRYDRLLRDLRRIWVKVQTGGNTGCYNANLDACELDPRYLRREDLSPSDIASVIVHEGTHARLQRRGIEFSESLRNRVEAICRGQEWAFSERLPLQQGEKIREKLTRMEQVRDDFWSDAQEAERQNAGTTDILRYLGVPAVLIPVVEVIRLVIRVVGRLVRAVMRLASGLTCA
jgi:hypothetical protein